MLSIGAQALLLQSHRRAVVQSFIGEGSQGSVFRALVDPGGESVALKWYFPSQGHDTQRRAIDELVERGAPDPRFLWPTEVAEVPGSNAFGYVMPLRPERFVGLTSLLRGVVDPPFSVVCTLGMELADSFLALHSEGLCYRDISFGNVFFDPATGRPLICDNDNVGVDGASSSAVLGTRTFMAPEIVRREAAPSTDTDLYSLAVLLFYVLMVGHPLLGRRELEFSPWDDHAESVVLGREPVFVFHPDDHTNAPVPGVHQSMLDNWPVYPPRIRTLFEQAFTVGLVDPRNGRVRESVWRAALAGLRDQIIRCPACGKESFWQGVEVACWSCHRTLERPVRLAIDGRELVLNQGTTVFRHHMQRDYDFVTPIARVVAHPDRPDRWGLRNESTETWEATTPGGDRLEAAPGRSIGLLPGTTIRVGASTASLVR